MLTFLIFCLMLNASDVSAFSLSADEMYRDLLNYENDSPPDVIVNRNAPDINPFKEDAPVINISKKNSEDKKDEKIRNEELEDTYQKLVEQKEAEEKAKWQQIVKAVQKNQATAFDIAEIKHKTNINNPDAVELLAWMYTTGSGVPQNLINAYDLYLKAHSLGVKDADKNAAIILKNMSRDERKKIPNFTD